MAGSLQVNRQQLLSDRLDRVEGCIQPRQRKKERRLLVSKGSEQLALPGVVENRRLIDRLKRIVEDPQPGLGSVDHLDRIGVEFFGVAVTSTHLRLMEHAR